MSHFTCLVTGDDVEGALAPFDENLQVEPYKDRMEGTEELDRAVAFYTKHPEHRGALTEADLESAGKGEIAGQLAVLRAYNDGEDVGYDDEGFFQMSTRNPNSKWDWWVVGGRWSGYFMLKDSFTVPADAMSSGNGGLAEQGSVILDGGKVAPIGSYVYRSPFGSGDREGNVDPRRADTAPKGVIDFAGMRAEKGKKAEVEWDRYQEVVDGLPPMTHWAEFRARVEAEQLTIDQARQQYHGQVRVERVREIGRQAHERRSKGEATDDPAAAWFWECEHESLDVERRLYVVRAEAQAVPAYALLHEGQWIAPGRMGWFGWSSDTENDRWGYLEHVNGLLDALPDDMQLTVCDLHI